MRCHYNTVNFLTDVHRRHPMARLLVCGMGCLFWVKSLIDILLLFLQLFMQYLTILDWVIMALNCIQLDKEVIWIWHPNKSFSSNGFSRDLHIFHKTFNIFVAPKCSWTFPFVAHRFSIFHICIFNMLIMPAILQSEYQWPTFRITCHQQNWKFSTILVLL